MKMATNLACEAFSSSPFFSFLTGRNTSDDKLKIGTKADPLLLEEWLGGVIIFAHIALRLKLRAQWYRANMVICLQSSVRQIKACVWRDGSGLPVGQQCTRDAFWKHFPSFPYFFALIFSILCNRKMHHARLHIHNNWQLSAGGVGVKGGMWAIHQRIGLLPINHVRLDRRTSSSCCCWRDSRHGPCPAPRSRSTKGLLEDYWA